MIEKEAKTHQRKALEKELKQTRSAYHDAKTRYQQLGQEIDRLTAQRDTAGGDMQGARDGMLSCMDKLRKMDLTGAGAVRERGDDVSFIVDGKEYMVDCSDVNDIKMTPYKEWKKSQKEEDSMEKADEEEADDMLLEANFQLALASFK